MGICSWSRESKTLGQKEKVGQSNKGIFLVDHVEPLKDHEQENGLKEAEETLNWGRGGWGQTVTGWRGQANARVRGGSEFVIWDEVRSILSQADQTRAKVKEDTEITNPKCESGS